MRQVLIIGIGTGDPDHLTVQAIRALNRTDAIFVLDKGEAAAELVRLRQAICELYGEGRPYRFVAAEDPKRDAGGPYEAAVAAWHARRADLYERLIGEELGPAETGAFLVWGDPALYDSTLRIIEAVAARGRVAFSLEVIPGLSSPQVLAARHRTVLNGIGAPVLITTGRRLVAEGLPAGIETGLAVVVMLDGEGAFGRFAARDDLEIVWGAYLGLPDEILIAGPLNAVAERIATVRAEARARKGWIMDTYLLRKRLA